MEPKSTLREILATALDAFLATHRLPLFVHRALQAMRICRTAALGGHIKACPRGHVEKVFYNSCGHRACPQCAFLKIEQWLETKRRQLLGCDHFHFTFTLPSELYVLWHYNYKAMADLLFRCAWETLSQLLADPKWMGATPGALMALHTWSRTLAFNPHVHVLLTGGGLAEDGTWKSGRRRHLLSLDVVRLIFKAKYRDGLRRLLRRGELSLPPDMNELDAEWQIEKALRRKWIVDRRHRYEHGRGVLTYLARYIRGGPIKNRRILAFDGETVTFRRSRHKEPFEAITLTVTEFLHRIVRHIPPPSFRTVRGYGLYAPTSEEKRDLCRVQLGSLPHDPNVEAELPGDASRATEEAAGRAEADTCPVCGLALAITWKMPRPKKRGPPQLRSTSRSSS